MKISYLSDLHLEFGKNRARLIKPKYRKDTGDVLCIAGDLDTLSPDFSYPKYTMNYLKEMSDKFSRVFIVPGNHEYWGKAWDMEPLSFTHAAKSFSHEILPRVKVCNNVIEEYNGITFALTTLWSHIDLEINAFLRSNDHQWLSNENKPITLDEFNFANKVSKDFILASNADVICTHYVPTFNIMHPAFQIYKNNTMFFNSGFDMLIDSPHLKTWIFGHAHMINYTKLPAYNGKLLTNPLGYTWCEDLPFKIGKYIIINK